MTQLLTVPDTRVDHTPTCENCKIASSSPHEIVSSHRTSEGTILYSRCPCGTLQVRLQRPDTGELLLAQGSSPSASRVGAGPVPESLTERAVG